MLLKGAPGRQIQVNKQSAVRNVTVYLEILEDCEAVAPVLAKAAGGFLEKET